MRRREAMGLAAAGAAAGIIGGSARAAPARAHAVSARDGTALFVRDWGEGRPVLFLAGWALPSDFWCYQMLHLAENGYRAIAYDRRGHGRSADPGRGYDHDTLADDLADIINGLGLEDAAIVAHSMGATETARYFARHRGAGIARAAFVGAITPFLMKTEDNPGGIDRAALAAMRAPLASDYPGWIDRNTPPFFTPDTSAEMRRWGKAMMMETSLLAAAQLARANAETDFRDDVRAIGVPLLVVHGDKDASAPLALTAEATAALAPRARLSVYEGAPHGLPLTHVDRLNAALLAFLADA